MPAPVTIPALPNTWTRDNLPDDAYAELGSATQPVGLGSAKIKALALIAPVVNVRLYGAKGDGTTDDTTAIQNAVNDFTSLVGGFLYFPRGTYKTTAKITGKSGVIFVGVGSGGSIIKAYHTGDAIVSFAGVTHAGMRDIQLATDTVTFPKTGLILGRTSAATAGYHQFWNLVVQGSFSKACLYSIASEQNIFTQCQFWTLDGAALYCLYTSQSDGLSIGGLTGSSNGLCLFQQCQFANGAEAGAGSCAVYVQAGAATFEWKWDSCYFVPGQGSYVTIDVGTVDGQDAAGPFVFDNCGGEAYQGSTADIPYGLHVTSAGSFKVKELRLSSSDLGAQRGATQNFIKCDSGATLDGAYIANQKTTTATVLDGLTNSVVWLTKSAITINGTCTGNSLRFASASGSLTFAGAQSNNVVFDESTGQWIEPTPAAKEPRQHLILDGTVAPQIGGISAINLTDFTFAAWVLPDSIAADQYIIGSQAGGLGTAGCSLRMAAGGTVYTQRPFEGDNPASTGKLVAGKWNHVAYVRSGGSAGVYYINGRSAGAITELYSNYVGTDYRVGGGTGASKLTGRCAPMMFPSALTAQQILDLYETGVPAASLAPTLYPDPQQLGAGTVWKSIGSAATITLAAGADWGLPWAGGLPIVRESSDTLLGPGAIPVDTLVTRWQSAAPGDAITLADGEDGQIKRIVHVASAGGGVLTPATACGFATVTFTNQGESVTLQWFLPYGWAVVAVYGAVVA